MLRKNRFNSDELLLRRCNIGASILHLVWCIVLLVYGSTLNGANVGWNQKLPVFCTKNAWCVKSRFLQERNASWNCPNVGDLTCGSNQEELCAGDHPSIGMFRETGRSVGLIPFMYICSSLYTLPLVISFFALSFLFHAFNVISCDYYDDIRKGFSLSRWMEYSLSASVMILIITYFLGINDLNTMVCFFTIIFSLQWFGYAGEYAHKAKSLDKYLFHFFGWIIMGIVIFLSSYQWSVSLEGANGAPDWLWLIITGDFVLFASFSFVQLYQFGVCGNCGCCGLKDNLHVQGEFMYIILSFVCKSFLGVIAAINIISQDVISDIVNEAA